MEGDPFLGIIFSETIISIHSLRMEGDRYNLTSAMQYADFNPLPPHGGRQEITEIREKLEIFQSTPSAWRETSECVTLVSLTSFQSTPSAWRETVVAQAFRDSGTNFNPLPPHGGRLVASGVPPVHASHFNPLPPHGGRLIYHVTVACTRRISIHSLRMEGDKAATVK